MNILTITVFHIGVTKLVFQDLGKVPEYSDKLNNTKIG